MGVLIRCKDANFSNYIGAGDYPIIPALKELFFFGGTESESIADRSGNNNNGELYGTETIGEKSIIWSGAGTENYMKLPTGTSGETSVHAVALVKKTGSRGVLSAISSSTAGGFAFSPERTLYMGGSSWVDLRTSLADADGYYPLAWSINSTGCALYRLNGNVLATVGSKSGGALNTNSMPRVIGGTFYNWAMNGTAEISAVGAYEGEVTENQLIDALKFLKAYGEASGLTVL